MGTKVELFYYASWMEKIYCGYGRLARRFDVDGLFGYYRVILELEEFEFFLAN